MGDMDGTSFVPENLKRDMTAWREERRTERAVESIDGAMRCVMDLFGGNLDHPALPFLEAAEHAVRAVYRGDEWHEFDCGVVGGGWPHPAQAHIDRVACATCGWSGQRSMTTPSRSRAGGCSDAWHTGEGTLRRDADAPVSHNGGTGQ